MAAGFFIEIVKIFAHCADMLPTISLARGETEHYTQQCVRVNGDGGRPFDFLPAPWNNKLRRKQSHLWVIKGDVVKLYVCICGHVIPCMVLVL